MELELWFNEIISVELYMCVGLPKLRCMTEEIVFLKLQVIGVNLCNL